jgi:hypothetical protein
MSAVRRRVPVRIRLEFSITPASRLSMRSQSPVHPPLRYCHKASDNKVILATQALVQLKTPDIPPMQNTLDSLHTSSLWNH